MTQHGIGTGRSRVLGFAFGLAVVAVGAFVYAGVDENEAAAIGSLRTLATAQSIFREGDKDGDGVLDYGSLKELGETKLIDSVLASGKKSGYRFECEASTTTSEFLWWATASPESPEAGKRHFATNQAGVIFESPTAITIKKDTCEIPKDLKPARRPDPKPARSAASAEFGCPECGAPLELATSKCPKDGTAAERADLIALHTILRLLAKGQGPQGPNPFAKLFKGDESLDVEALDKLIADYKAANARHPFGKIGLPGLEQAKKHGNEASAIGALKTIATSQSIFREGDKDGDGVLDYGSLEELAKTNLIDSVLGSGSKQGYLFRCEASPTTSEFLWWATASPANPDSGERYFFTNQAGVIFYGTTAFEVNKKTCEVPKGLTPVGR